MRTITVTIYPFGSIAAFFAKEEYTVPVGTTVRSLLKILSAESPQPEFGQVFYESDGENLKNEILIMINDTPMHHLKGMDTVLKNRDLINVIPFDLMGG